MMMINKQIVFVSLATRYVRLIIAVTVVMRDSILPTFNICFNL